MSYYFKNIKPSYDDDSDEVSDEQDLDAILASKMRGRAESDDESSEEEDDGLSKLSFGSLKKAEDQLEEEERGELRKKRKPQHSKPIKDEPEVRHKVYKEEEQEESDSESGSDDGAFFEEDERDNHSRPKNKNSKKRKHAPTEHSSKKRVSKIRDIPGLEIARQAKSGIYQDVRFTKATGEATDFSVIRRRYKFLDEYREKEIEEMERLLNDKKFVNKAESREIENMKEKVRSMKSRLQSVKNRELEQQIVKDYEGKLNEGNKNRFHLKKAEKRKVIQKWKFDHMKAKQREKVMERKRKKKLGKEFKQFEFHNR